MSWLSFLFPKINESDLTRIEKRSGKTLIGREINVGNAKIDFSWPNVSLGQKVQYFLSFYYVDFLKQLLLYLKYNFLFTPLIHISYNQITLYCIFTDKLFYFNLNS